ncbi:hypothetical protein QEN19_000060 [Hanseniaspora menglaensis]
MLIEEQRDDSIISFSDEYTSSNSSIVGVAVDDKILVAENENYIKTSKYVFLDPCDDISDMIVFESNHKEPAIITASTISTALINNFKDLLDTDYLNKEYKSMNKNFKNGDYDMINFFSVMSTSVPSGFNNQLTRLTLLIIQLDLIEAENFDEIKIDSAASVYVDEICSIFETTDKKFLFAVYSILKPMILKTFADKYHFFLFFMDKFISFKDLCEKMDSSLSSGYDVHYDIEKKLSKLSFHDNNVNNLKTAGYVGKCWGGKEYSYNWRYSDDSLEVLGSDCAKFPKHIENYIFENFSFFTDHTISMPYKLQHSLNQVSAGFQQISQSERLSLNSLSLFASQYLIKNKSNELQNEDQIFFGHRGVMTKLIMLINDKEASTTTFRAYKYKDMIFFQPIEKVINYNSNSSNAPGFSFEYIMTNDAGNSEDDNSFHYLFNSFEINGLKFVIQAEIDVAAVKDKEKLIPFELKTISASNYNNIFTRNRLFMKSWAQNYFLGENSATLVGVRSNKNTLKEASLHTQDNLLHSWKKTITSNKASILSDFEIKHQTNKVLAHIFQYVKFKMSNKNISDTQILMYEFAVSKDVTKDSVHTSDFFSKVFDLSNETKFAEYHDEFTKESLAAIHKNMNAT